MDPRLRGDDSGESLLHIPLTVMASPTSDVPSNGPYRPQSTNIDEMRSFHPRPTNGTLPAQVCRRPPKLACSKVVMTHPGAQASEEILSFQKPLRYPMLLLAWSGS